ncbi:MAG: RDD family protein [Flavisolibacter sp.]
MTTEQPVQPAEQHLFEDNELYQFTEASRTQRFLNLVIDMVFMQYALGILTGYLAFEFVNLLSPEMAYNWFGEEDGFNFLVIYLLGIFDYLVYYTFCEKLFKGYTLGKLITGTRAIRTDGSELTFKDAILRSLVRMVPFEHLSGFGYPWHDTWTKTMVIKTR